MLLPDFVLPYKINHIEEYASKSDEPGQCLNLDHYRSYPYEVKYKYNSRGYRDIEWPEDIKELKDCIFCFGDSFTLGVGSPYEHTWPYVLSKITNCRTLNISMNGASNDWMARKYLSAVRQLGSITAVFQWSYLRRREMIVSDNDRDNLSQSTAYELSTDNFNHFVDLIAQIESNKQGSIIHSFIPMDYYKTILLSKILSNKFPNIMLVSPIKIIDFARDYLHYDLKTSQKFAKLIDFKLKML